MEVMTGEAENGGRQRVCRVVKSYLTCYSKIHGAVQASPSQFIGPVRVHRLFLRLEKAPTTVLKRRQCTAKTAPFSLVGIQVSNSASRVEKQMQDPCVARTKLSTVGKLK